MPTTNTRTTTGAISTTGATGGNTGTTAGTTRTTAGTTGTTTVNVQATKLALPLPNTQCTLILLPPPILMLQPILILQPLPSVLQVSLFLIGWFPFCSR